MERLDIFDATALLFRSFFAIPLNQEKNNRPANALFGMARYLSTFLKRENPQHLVAVFDGPHNKAARQALDPNYKAHREKMPDELGEQIAPAYALCKALGIPHLISEGVEADDVMGSVACWGSRQGSLVRIDSRDKDLCQLVNESIVMIDSRYPGKVIDREEVRERHGVNPEQIVDYLAMVGDVADNIPGIRGVGPKKASNLINSYGSIEGIFQHLDALPSGLALRFKEGREQLMLSRRLVALDISTPCPQEVSWYARKIPPLGDFPAWCQENALPSLIS
ncbi:MAG: 5'-3' exonuclease [Chlamydiota bacterium]|nr:5'-3' exonuclease [Chlamydiota bacterium]